jgi:hypothetical protein
MEHEIKDHALKAYKTMKKPGLSIWHKIKEIAIEIAIIVFAVTISIWFHDMSEHSHEQKEVKAFLLGLKKDLASDVIQLQEDRDMYATTGKAFAYISTKSPNFKLNQDSLKKYQISISNTTDFISNNGRYEGFKSSGKLGNIEDDELQNDITELYQGIIPTILASTNSYSHRKEMLFEYFYENIRQNAGGSNIIAVLSADEGKNICTTLAYTGEITTRYDKAIKKSKEIISKINAIYGN